MTFCKHTTMTSEQLSFFANVQLQYDNEVATKNDKAINMEPGTFSNFTITLELFSPRFARTVVKYWSF